VPLAFGWTLPTNDLIWWVPFGLLLYHAWKAHQRPTHETPTRDVPRSTT
jgi:hypothetical protein